ncbi:hypothetical protein [Phycicoccus avicenniae]|uniref:hypothetical protein n=1 Tax=Phycicoccus avicenniae TaxID=2828860 RepID=UPI003D2AEBA0
MVTDVDEPPVDIVDGIRPMAVLVTHEPLSTVRLGDRGPVLTQVTSAPVPGSPWWLSTAELPSTWLQAWPEMHWTTRAGGLGITPAPPSVITEVPGLEGDQGWQPITVRFTSRPSLGGPLVNVEHAAGSDMRSAPMLALLPPSPGTFVRGDGGDYASVYGLTTSEPMSITPVGDRPSRFTRGWRSTSVELRDGLWATAIQLTGMDDSSVDPLRSIAWTDASGARHSTKIAR